MSAQLPKLTLDFPADLPLPAPMNIDPEERAELPRRLFAMASRRLEHAAHCAGQGEATGLGGATMADLAASLHDCGQDLLVLADAIAVLTQEATE
jgi:hypothetical protein